MLSDSLIPNKNFTGYSGAYYKFLTDEETAQNINLLGGASQTVTATYTGDETYVKPTVETVLDGFGNKVSETYYKHWNRYSAEQKHI